MAYDGHANFAYSTVATAPSPATSGTSLTVATGDGSKFPAPPFNATVWPAGTQPTSANAEIVRVTAGPTGSDTFTITRAQEGSSARSIGVGDQIDASITKKMFTDIEIVAPNALVTSPPGSPVDGQVIFYQADATNGIVWQLRYNAGSSSPHKWEFVGGMALSSEVDTSETTTSTTFVDLATVGPQITLPLAGDWEFAYGQEGNSSAINGFLVISLNIGGTEAGADELATGGGSGTAGDYRELARVRRKTGLSASTVVKLQYRTTSGTGTFRNRWLRATPVRVG